MDETDFRESDIVVSQDDLLRPYGKARLIKIKRGLAEAEYVPHIFSRPPYFTHIKFLRLEETEKFLSPVDRLQNRRFEETWKFDMRQMAARFLTANKGGQLSCIRAELLPHQIFTAYEVIKSKRRRFLLAHAGKTGKIIEAGLIWEALFQRRVADRTLIICPAGLMLQWQEEIEEKFGTFFEIFNRNFLTINPRMWDLKTTVIVSIEGLKQAEAKLLKDRQWDLIIIDEAHKLSAGEHRSTLAEQLKDHTDALILLTATPHQGEDNHARFINLMKLLDEEIDFNPLFHGDLPLFKTKTDPGKVPFYQYILGTPKMAVTDASGRKLLKGRKTHNYTFEMFPDENEFYKAVTNYIKKGYSCLERLRDKQDRQALCLVLSLFQKIAASSTAAIKNSLRNRKLALEYKNGIVREKSKFEDERFSGEYEESQVPFEFEKQFIKDEVKEIDSLLDMEVRQDTKSVELLNLIHSIFDPIADEKEGKIVIFTEYLATQKHLVDILEHEYGQDCTITINGNLDVDQRRLNQREFRDNPRIHFLVSTESGGEGGNLQCSHILFNYDMPWNPRRIEQRVRRVYRYGQAQVVQIHNFRTKGTSEDKIYGYIEEKIERAASALTRVTGEDVEGIMAAMYDEMENEIDYNEIYKRSLVEGDIEEAKEEIDRGVARAKRAYELAAEKLFKDVSAYSPDYYEKYVQSDITLQDLAVFTRRYLESKRKKSQKTDGIFSFITPEEFCDREVKDRYENVTFDRKKAGDQPELELLALGHPFIDKMVNSCGTVDFGGYATTRIIKNKKFSGTKGIQFNYVVSHRIERGEKEEYLFDMYTIFIDESYQINDDIAHICRRYYSENDHPIVDNGIDVDIKKAEKIAENYLRKNIDIIRGWQEDVELLNAALVQVQ